MARVKTKRAKERVSASAQLAQPAPVSLPEGFRVKKQVILPSLSLQVDQARVLKFLDAMRVSNVKTAKAMPTARRGKKFSGDEDDARPEKPATVAPVVDVRTGEQFTLIVPAVLEANLREQYPEDAYVGCTFFVMKKAKRPGKRYFDFEISEVESD